MQGESSADKKDRLRQRRAAEQERSRAAQEGAGGLTQDWRSVYGTGGLSMFSGVPVVKKKKAVKTDPGR